ncbi:MAG TPA: SRPBCC domain-containing protein [Chryseolinea sp.]|nr:SRPBCC domain-containing protein [Chryseolinea sp.]
MLAPQVISKEIEIRATADKVWHVFINPAVTRQMGGEYVSDWKVGGPIGWKGKDGAMYTNGSILEIEPARLLKHDLKELENPNTLLSVITYRFTESNGSTLVSASEELNYPADESQLEDIADGWDFALSAIKDISEGLK